MLGSNQRLLQDLPHREGTWENLNAALLSGTYEMVREMSKQEVRSFEKEDPDLTPGSKSTGLRIDIPSAAMYNAAMYTEVRVR